MTEMRKRKLNIIMLIDTFIYKVSCLLFYKPTFFKIRGGILAGTYILMSPRHGLRKVFGTYENEFAENYLGIQVTYTLLTYLRKTQKL